MERYGITTILHGSTPLTSNPGTRDRIEQRKVPPDIGLPLHAERVLPDLTTRRLFSVAAIQGVYDVHAAADYLAYRRYPPWQRIK